MAAVKRTTRTKKIEESPISTIEIPSMRHSHPLTNTFTEILNTLEESKAEFENLQKEITETKEAWIKEQKNHETALLERNQQEEITHKREQEMEEIARKREKETYEYETKLTRKKAEDEFQQMKYSWERELAENQQKIAAERKELEELRKEVANFETEREKAVKDAVVKAQKEMQEKFDVEKRLREQEFKSEKEMCGLKIANHIQENTRQKQEIEVLKKSLDATTKQLKEVAVRVIEANRPQLPTPKVNPSE